MRNVLLFYFILNYYLFDLDSGEYHYNLVRDVIDLYLECDVWYLPTSIENNSTTNIADAQKNVIQICLMTEGLSKLVSSLPVTQQSLCLIHCLYPILERVGSEHGPISLAGNTLIHHALIRLFTQSSYFRSISNNITCSLWWI